VYAGRTFPSARSVGEHLPFPNKVFDAVMFVSTIDHMINPSHALVEARRVLRPGGYLLVEETCRAVDLGYIKWLLHSRLGRRPYRYNRFHNWAYTERSLKQVIRHAGFSIVSDLRSTSQPNEAIIIAQIPIQ
jgi:ubiquinone/menaquinone biosynthesis C-methylase UbiE